MPGQGHVFIRGAALPDAEAALRRVLAGEGYVPFEASRVPAGYPAERGEFSRVAIGGTDAPPTVEMVLGDWDGAFRRAVELSRALPAATVVAAVRPPEAHVRWKVFRAGDLVLKIGADPDGELFYNAPASGADAVASFLAGWEGAASAATDDPGRALGLARRDCGFGEAVAGAWAAPLEVRLFVSRRSRLYLES